MSISEFIGNVSWVLLTILHASLLRDDLPEGWCPTAIPVALMISSIFGLAASEESRWRWTLKIPGPLIILVVLGLCVEFWVEINDEVEEDVRLYFSTYFGFWLCVAVKATDISQVLLPMFLLVRPVHCVILVLVLSFYRPHGN